MPPEKTATALKGLKDLRARIVSQERERTRSRLPGGGQGEASEAPTEGPAATNSLDANQIPSPSPTAGITTSSITTIPAPSGNPSPTAPIPESDTAHRIRSAPSDVHSSEPELPEPIMGEAVPTSEQPAGEITPMRPTGDVDKPPITAPESGNASGSPDSHSPASMPTLPLWRTLLAGQCDKDGWSEETLMAALIEDTLRARQPTIRVGSEILAKADRFRSIHCPPGSSRAILQSDQGRFHLQPRPTNPRLAHWKRHYELMGQLPSDAKLAAHRRTLLELLEHLRSARDFRVGGWVKQVSPDDFDVARQPQP